MQHETKNTQNTHINWRQFYQYLLLSLPRCFYFEHLYINYM